ncbi:transmembrane protein 45B-like [Lingula anatina]|uniref:Transmembrane protein 45B-like n=1 Tax=Lingula anatina TaxID=7574 RepID=A0A1S3HEM2_LINAN|nr:transmembrane protein 45B-like [Lingula anatina]|eukprot:XP_013384527.1 transmembrane protein 45B-like [Lingula anatina]
MGTFMGHFIPGSFFFGFGLWWTIQIWINFFRAQGKKNQPFRCRVTYPCNCFRLKCCSSTCWEGLLKVFLTGFGIVGETITGFDDNWHFVHMGNAQHITMFFMFGLTGVVDLMHFYKAPIPKKCDYLSVVLALVVECILFMFHLHGRTMLDIHVHTLLIYTLYFTIAAVLAEMYFDRHMLAAFIRSFLFLAQGTWFVQAGFILYNPLPGALPWKEDSPHEVMLVTLFFTWHLGCLFVIMLCIGGVVNCCLRYRGSNCRRDDMAMQRLLDTDSNGQTMVRMDASDSDIEFQSVPTRIADDDL